MKVVLELSKREAESLLRAELSSGWGVKRSATLVSAETRLRTAVRAATQREAAPTLQQTPQQTPQEAGEDAQALEAVRRLHRMNVDGNCDHCWNAFDDQPIPWPCQTMQALLGQPLHGPAPS